MRSDRIDRVEILDLVVEIALGGGIISSGPRALNQDLEKQREEIEVFLGRRKGKRIDLKSSGFKAHAYVRAAKELCEAFEAAAQIEDEGVAARTSAGS